MYIKRFNIQVNEDDKNIQVKENNKNSEVRQTCVPIDLRRGRQACVSFTWSWPLRDSSEPWRSLSRKTR